MKIKIDLDLRSRAIFPIADYMFYALLCSVLCALCSVLCALCSVLCALCTAL